MHRSPWFLMSVLLADVLVSGLPAAMGGPAASPDEVGLPLVLQWKYSSVEEGAPLPPANMASAPIIDKDTLYFSGRVLSPDKIAMPSIYALSLETGEKLWDHPLEGTVFGTPALGDKTLWVAASRGLRGELYCLDTTQGGRERLRFQLTHGTHATPVISDGILYIGDDDGLVVAIDTKKEQIKWQFQAGGSVEAPVAVSPEQKLIYVCSSQPESNLYAINMETGKEYWRREMPDVLMGSAPIISGNYLYVVSGRMMMCLGLRKGQMRWTNPQTDSIIGTPALLPADSNSPARLFFSCRDGSVNAVDANTGRLLWKHPVLLECAPRSPVLATRTVLLVGAESGHLYAVSPATGRTLWEYRAVPPKDIAAQTTSIGIAAQPASQDGRVAVLVNEGTLLCFAPEAADNSAPETKDAIVQDITDQAWGMDTGIARVSGDPPLQFRLTVVDEGSGVDPSKLVLMLDGLAVNHRFDARTGELSYSTPVTQPMRPLADGRHTITLKVVDWKGNENQCEWPFEADSRIKRSGSPGATTTTNPGMGGVIR